MVVAVAGTLLDLKAVVQRYIFLEDPVGPVCCQNDFAAESQNLDGFAGSCS